MDICSSDRCAVAQQQCKDTHCFWQSAIAPCSVLLCKRGWQQACATANTPMEIGSSDRCAVAQQQCKDTLLLAKCNCPLLGAAVQNRLTAGFCDCNYTYGDWLFRQVCSGPTARQGHTLLLAKCKWPLLSAAVQKRLAAGLCDCNYTYGDWLFRQVCSGPTAEQCHTAFGKVQLPPARCCCAKQADSRLVRLQLHLWRLALQTGVQWPYSSARTHTAFGKVQLAPAQCCCAKDAGSRLVPLQIHLWRLALQTGVQWPNSRAVPHCFWQSAIAPCSVLRCKTG